MVDLQALADELTSNPLGLGYTGDDAADAGLLNDPGASGETVRRSAIPMGEIYGQIDWDGEYLAMTPEKREAFQVITSTEYLDVTSQHIRDAFVAIFGAGSTTLGGLQSILDRDASRAEILFGVGVRVSPSHVADARRL